MKPKRRAFQIGDTVRILKPQFVERVGYPLHWRDLVYEMAGSPAVNEASRALGFSQDEKAMSEFVAGAARAMVRARRFGGSVRSIHYQVVDKSWCAAGYQCTVCGKRTVLTGNYVSRHASYSPSNGDYDCRPPYLDNAKRHVLLNTEFGWIEAANVELINAASV